MHYTKPVLTDTELPLGTLSVLVRRFLSFRVS